VTPHAQTKPDLFADHELAGCIERRRNEIWIARFGRPPHERGTAARGLPRKDVALRVADHPRTPKVEVELASEPKDHSGPWLSAVAFGCLVVRAIAERLNPATVLGEIALDAAFQRAEHDRIQHPKRDSALI
jgi:hypothetical protein